jgi:predicted MFS family arabinose efflux permease
VSRGPRGPVEWEAAGPPGPPAPLDPGLRTRSAWLLVGVRAAYAYNWFDIGPAFPGLGTTFGVGPAGWGILLGAFLAGAGLCQVPAGLLARRFGLRPLALGGAAVLAAAALASALAPSFPALIASRAIAGAGAGLFFSPAIGLVASLYPEGSRGVPVGGFSSAFSAGAALGLYASAVLAAAIGWRADLAVGAAGLAAVTLAAFLLIPRSTGLADRRRRAGGVGWSRTYAVLRRPEVWAIGLAFVGCEGASFATGQFVVPFGEALRGWSPALAGAVGASFVLPSVLGGPLGGAIAERNRRHRAQLAVPTLVGAIGLALLPFASLGGAFAIGSVFSFSYGFAYAVMYVTPLFWNDLDPSEVPLAIAMFNGVQLAGGGAVALAFGGVVGATSYPVAWEFAAAIEVATLAALLLWRAGGPRDGGEPALR